MRIRPSAEAVPEPAAAPEPEGVECAICFNPNSMLVDTSLMMTPCGHTFCRQCLGVCRLKAWNGGIAVPALPRDAT